MTSKSKILERKKRRIKNALTLKSTLINIYTRFILVNNVTIISKELILSTKFIIMS